MRLAVFTNEFPSRVSTFFARDMRGLIDAGIDVEVFPIYPLNASMWGCVPRILDERVLPRTKVHHLPLSSAVRHAKLWPPAKVAAFLRDTLTINKSAIPCGLEGLAK